MKYNNLVLLPTHQFYTEPSATEYDSQKAAELTSLDYEYNTKTTQEKWSLLITKLKRALDPDNLPCPNFDLKLDVFEAKRKNVTDSRFNLKLAQCVSYFEDFYFLYTTTDQRFQLKKETKAHLLATINDVVDNTCETGINGRFYTVLQDHQRQTDWIKNELTAARCAILRRIHDGYVTENNVAPALNIHIYHQLVLLANKKHMGIPIKTNVDDVFEYGLESKKIADYFTLHYQQLFSEYENQSIQMLTNHYLQEVSDIFSINNTEWENTPVSITGEQSVQLKESLDKYFKGLPLDWVMDELGELSEDNLSFNFKIKSSFAQTIRKLIADKLIQDGFFQRLDLLMTNPTEQSELRLKPGISLADLTTMYQALKNENIENLNQIKNSTILINYPELFIAELENNINLLSILPQWLRMDSRFIDNVMKVLDQNLCKAIDEADEAKITSITNTIIKLIHTEYGYLDQLSPKVFDNKIFAKCLLKENGLLLHLFSKVLLDENKDILELVEATTSRTFAFLFTDCLDPAETRDLDTLILKCHQFKNQLNQVYQTDVQLRMIENASFGQLNRKLLRIAAFNTMLTCSNLSADDFLSQVNYITPHLLNLIIEYRQNNHLTPLPFCASTNCEKNLKQFNTEIGLAVNPDWEKDYILIKRQACEKENFTYIMHPYKMKTSVTFVSKTNNWFMAFQQYHAYQSSIEKVAALLSQTYHALMTLLFSSCKFALLAGFHFLTLNIFSYLLIGTIIFSLGLSFINYFTQIHALRSISDVFYTALMIEGILIFSFYALCTVQLIDAYKAGSELLQNIGGIFQILRNLWVFPKTHMLATEYPIQQTCDEIIYRLDILDAPSAHEKSYILKQLRDHILTDLKTNTSMNCKDILHHPYPITHREIEYNISFFEVAGIKRSNNETFSLSPKAPSIFSFFSSKTTTSKLLDVSINKQIDKLEHLRASNDMIPLNEISVQTRPM